MRSLVPLLALLLAAVPALADTITPADAKSHVGQSVTVEGVVSEVHFVERSGMTFIDMGGSYPNNAFTAVIFPDSAKQFPGMVALAGRKVDVSGTVRLYHGRPEIVLTSAGQLKKL